WECRLGRSASGWDDTAGRSAPRTQSVRTCVPTQSVGTRRPAGTLRPTARIFPTFFFPRWLRELNGKQRQLLRREQVVRSTSCPPSDPRLVVGPEVEVPTCIHAEDLARLLVCHELAFPDGRVRPERLAVTQVEYLRLDGRSIRAEADEAED